MIKIGVTGHKGFIGTHLCNRIKLNTNQFKLINFQSEFFDIEKDKKSKQLMCLGIKKSTNLDKLLKVNVKIPTRSTNTYTFVLVSFWEGQCNSLLRTGSNHFTIVKKEVKASKTLIL